MNQNKTINDPRALENLISFALTRHKCYSDEVKRLMDEEGIYLKAGQKAVHTFLNCCGSAIGLDPMGMVLLSFRIKAQSNKNAARNPSNYQSAASLESNPFLAMMITTVMAEKKFLHPTVRGIMEYFNLVRLIENLNAGRQFGFDFFKEKHHFTLKRSLYEIFLKINKNHPEYSEILKANVLIVLAENNFKNGNISTALRRLLAAEVEIIRSCRLEKIRGWLLARISFWRFQIEPPTSAEEIIRITTEILVSIHPLNATPNDIHMALRLYESRSAAQLELGNPMSCIHDRETIIHIISHCDHITDSKVISWVTMIEHYQISDVYSTLGRYSKSLNHLNAAIDVFAANGEFKDLKSEISMTLKHELRLQKSLLIGDKEGVKKTIEEYQIEMEQIAQHHGFNQSSAQIANKWMKNAGLEKFFKNGPEAWSELASDFYIFSDNKSSPAQTSRNAALLSLYHAIHQENDQDDTSSDADFAIRRLFATVDWNQPRKLIMRLLFAGISWVDEIGEGITTEQWKKLRQSIEEMPQIGFAEKKSSLALMEIRRAIGLHSSGSTVEDNVLQAIVDASALVAHSEYYIDIEIFDILELIALHLKVNSIGLMVRASEVLSGLEKILWALESIAQAYFDKEDRVTINARMKRIYLDLASSYSASLSLGGMISKSLEGTIAKYISFYADRASSRFFTSFVLPYEFGDDIEKGRIPEAIVEEYVAARIEVSNTPDYPLEMLDEETTPDAIAGTKAVEKRSIQRLAQQTDEKEPPLSKAQSGIVSAAKKRLCDALKEIYAYLPDFNQDRLGHTYFSMTDGDISKNSHYRLHLFTLHSKLHSIVHDAGGCRWLILSTQKSVAVLQGIFRFAKDVSKPPERRKDLAQSAALSEWISSVGELLILPRDGHCGGELEICVSSELSGVPFHAMALGAGEKLLGEMYDVFYNSSFGLGLKTKKRPRAKGGISIACSITDSNDLACAVVEAEAMWNTRPDVRRLVGQAATFNNIRSQVRNSAIFHFCGHTNGSGFSRALATADGKSINIEYCLNHPFIKMGALVILNACESGKVTGGISTVNPISQQPRASESPRFENFLATDTLGLASTFLLGGAKSVVATLWTVNDSSSSLFMWKLTKLLVETNGSWNLPKAVAQSACWLRDIPSGRMLRDEILPQFLSDLGGSVIGEDVLRNCVQEFSRIYDGSLDSPPYRDWYYWGPYAVVGSPSW